MKKIVSPGNLYLIMISVTKNIVFGIVKYYYKLPRWHCPVRKFLGLKQNS